MTSTSTQALQQLKHQIEEEDRELRDNETKLREHKSEVDRKKREYETADAKMKEVENKINDLTRRRTANLGELHRVEEELEKAVHNQKK